MLGHDNGRRRFLLQVGGGATLGLAGGAAALAELGGRSQRPPVRLGSLDEIPPGTARVFADQGLVLVHRHDGRLRALSTRCTHLGCRLALVGDELRCPCHRGRFDLEGRVVAGPPRQPLPRFALRLAASGAVYYHPDRWQQR